MQGDHPTINEHNKQKANPLRSNDNIKWFKTKQKTCNESYLGTVDEKLCVLELKRLFERFDIDKSGNIDLDELGLMFETAGLIIDCELLKKIFRQSSGRNVKFQCLEVEEFAKLMTQKHVEHRFKKLIKNIRHRYAQHDYSMQL